MSPRTPKQAHREGVLARFGNVCYAGPQGCSGRVQSAHWLPVQRLKIKRRNAAIARGGMGFYTPPETAAILAVSEDDLIADPRNGVPLCELHHGRFDRLGLELEPPACVREFADEFGLTHLLPTTNSTEEAA